MKVKNQKNLLFQKFSKMEKYEKLLFPRISKRLKISTSNLPERFSIKSLLQTNFKTHPFLGEFCSNHRSALNTFKWYMTEDQTFAEWYKHCLQNPLLKKKGIPECILFVTQRLTKYPLLIQPLLKSSVDDKIEQEKLLKAMHMVKEILVDVDSRVADKDKEDRQLEIFKRIDAKSHAILKLIDERSDSKEIKIKEMKFKKSDIISSNRKLK